MFRRQQKEQNFDWKTRTYIIGTLLGTILGFLSAYLYAQEANENLLEDEESPDIPPTAFLGLALSVLGVVRKIAETGKTKKKK